MTKLFVLFLFICALAAIAEASSHLKPTDLIASPCTGKNTKITRAYHDANAKSRADCPYNRSDVITVAQKGYDLNGDGLICIDEIITLENHYLSAAEIALLNLIETPETIIRRCDCDNDGCISQWDFENSIDTCLRDCPALRRIKYFLGDRVDGEVMGKVKAPEAIDQDLLMDGKIPTK